MHLILLRHGSRLDKGIGSSSDSHANDASTWLAPFDPPLNMETAPRQIELAVKKIKGNLRFEQRKDPKIYVHSSPYNRCVQTAELLLASLNQPCTVKLRVDKALSEWLHSDFDTKYLPPNDSGASMISNINNYIHNFADNDTLKRAKDPMWVYNRLGECGDYGESLKELKRRCFKFLTSFLQFYARSQKSGEDKNSVIVIISHGAVISTLLQILLNRSVFNEIPLATPIYFKQSSNKRTVFNITDYDKNLSSILSISNDRDLHSLLRSEIDLDLLELDNIYEEFEPSLPTTKTRGRPRSSTYQPPSMSLSAPTGGFNNGETSDEEPIRHSHSSRQLRSLEIPSGDSKTGESKFLDVGKLATYFGGYSGSDSESESESDSESDPGAEDDMEHKDVLSMSVKPKGAISTPRIDAKATESSENEKSGGLSALYRRYGLDEEDSTDNDSKEFVLGFGNQELAKRETVATSVSDIQSLTVPHSRPRSGSYSLSDYQSQANLTKQHGVIDGTFSNFYFDTPKSEEKGSSTSFLEYLKTKKPKKAITIISTMFNTSKKTRPSDNFVETSSLESLAKPTSSSDSGEKRFKISGSGRDSFGCYSSPGFAKSEDDGSWFGGNVLQRV
ncbi:unnamed protein product [Kuraishia capsulata CBS 1993]|uniref:Uncharacterized protein n=1 Tax=Kuraishia capsulata CBS 1993 TaxID=1382522 RepID=W6MME7_9ASCO|nr:uncharacterized protein KUCA_T00003738001 [Kuraishia capsulata CBS 1993]CDK27759.1 unnamed protein product [Kuraishia capsulata CBS 1993]